MLKIKLTWNNTGQNTKVIVFQDEILILQEQASQGTSVLSNIHSRTIHSILICLKLHEETYLTHIYGKMQSKYILKLNQITQLRDFSDHGRSLDLT